MKWEMKMPNFTFYGRRKQATAELTFSFWSWIWFLGIRLKRVRLHLTELIEVKAIERTQIHFLSEIFVAVTVVVWMSFLLKHSLDFRMTIW